MSRDYVLLGIFVSERGINSIPLMCRSNSSSNVLLRLVFFIESYFCCSGATCMVALIAGVSSENCNSFGVAYIFVQRRPHYLEVISRVYSLCLAPTRLGQNWVLDPALSHCSVTTDHTLWMRPKRFQNLTCRTSGLLLMANATEWNWPLVRCVHSTKRGSLYSLIRALL